jgi:hypothetical protein
VVITPKPIVVPDPVEPAKEKARGPEVEDSIAAVASQLLASSPDAVMLDVRTPPLMKQKHPVEAVGTATPVKEEETGTWSLVSTTNLNEKPVTKVPLISKTTTTTTEPPMSTKASMPAISSTRFPPRKPTPGVVEKVPMVEVSMRNPSTEKPILATTTKQPATIVRQPVTTTSAPNKPAAVVITKKPTPSSPSSGKPAPIAITVLKRNLTAVTTTKAPTTVAPIKLTTKAPVPLVPITEKIPVMPTRKPQTPVVIKITTAVPATKQTTTITPKPVPALPVIKPVNIPKPDKAPLVAIKPSEVNLPTKIITERPHPIDFEKISFSKPSQLSTQVKVQEPITVSEPDKVSTTVALSTTEVPSTTVAPLSTTTKRPRRKTNKKKNKNRRRRPSKPSTAITENLENKEVAETETVLTKPPKPLSTRIYNFISRDVMPNFGVGVVGLLVTAGLAGLLLLPIDGFARRSDVNKREDEQDGIIPSIIQAVMTSLSIGEKKYEEEQGPRRYRRQVNSMYNEVDSNDEPSATPVPAPDNPSFSFVRFMKQLLAVKLEVMANMLRVASEALRNYAQNAGQRPQRPQIGTTTTPETATEKVDLLEPATSEATTVETVTEKINFDDKEESNLVRRRTSH